MVRLGSVGGGRHDHEINRGEERSADEVVPVTSDEQALARPIGWWLKEADTRLKAAFDSALEDTEVDRRGWQILTSLSRGPTRRSDLISALASFDPPAEIDEIIDRMSSRGWVEESAHVARLTATGAAKQEALAPVVDGVRQQVAAALPRPEYTALVGLLSRLVEAFPPAT
jgi:DNA-binding MarR family transcriptional regulator